MRHAVRLMLTIVGGATLSYAAQGSVAVGSAPKGDASSVASRIIKYNFPACKQVSSVARRPDGAIRATCDGKDYLVFTVFNPKEGRVIEVALNCTAAKQMLDVTC